MSQEQQPQPPEPQKDTPPAVYNVSGKGNIFGSSNTISQTFNNIINGDPRMRWYLLGVAVLIIATGAALFFLLRAPQQEILPMSGVFNIAVAEFNVVGNNNDPDLGMTIARTVYTNLETNLADMKSTYGIEIRDPVTVKKAIGSGKQVKDLAQQVADANGAHLVVYGDVAIEGARYKITPKFYVSPKLMVDHQEVTGMHTLGQSMPINKQNDVVFKRNLTAQMSERMRVLTIMIAGLSSYSVHDYADALSSFQAAETAWPKEISSEVLSLMEGNAAGSIAEYDLAEQYFNRALEQDPQYARAMIGMGSVYYMRSLLAANKSKNLADIDQELLKKSVETYQSALQAEHKPEGADIETKVHLSVGKCYLLQAETGVLPSYDAALQEFIAVTQAYETDPESQLRIQELAGEAYGHQGTIHKRMSQLPEAIEDYEKAVELLDTYPERCKIYKKYLVALGGSSTYCATGD